MNSKATLQGLSNSIFPDAPMADRAPDADAQKPSPFTDIAAQNRAAGAVTLAELADVLQGGADALPAPTPPSP